MTHPEALTFPELLETVPNDAYLNIQHETEPEVRIIPVGRYCHNAAAALRRLQVARERDNVSFKELLAQRDALLELLDRAADTLHECGLRDEIYAAIKAVEENK